MLYRVHSLCIHNESIDFTRAYNRIFADYMFIFFKNTCTDPKHISFLLYLCIVNQEFNKTGVARAIDLL